MKAAHVVLGLSVVGAALLLVMACSEEQTNPGAGGAGTGGGTGAGEPDGGGLQDGGTIPDAAPPLPEITCDYYVNGAAGDDGASGQSEADAWATIQHAADTLVAGETVCIMAGTYAEQVTVMNDGAEGAPITFAANPGDEVTIDGSTVNVPQGDGLFQLSDRSHIRVSGLRVINSSWAGILVERSYYVIIDHNFTLETLSSGIGVWRSEHVLVDGNEIRRARNGPGGSEEWLTMAVSAFFEIRHNTIHDGLDLEQVISIDVKDGSNDGLVYGNHIYDISGLGIYVDAWDKHVTDVDIFGNFVHDCGSGIALASERGGPVERIRIYNNVIARASWVGIGLMTWGASSGGDGPRSSIRILNNTVVEATGHGGAGIYLESTNVADVLIRNSIVDLGDMWVGHIRASAPAGVTADHNLVHGESDYPEEELGGSLEGDPLFVAPAAQSAADLQLQSGSPAIDQGSADEAPADDFAGTPRPLDGDASGSAEHDLGAFEHGES